MSDLKKSSGLKPWLSAIQNLIKQNTYEFVVIEKGRSHSAQPTELPTSKAHTLVHLTTLKQ